MRAVQVKEFVNGPNDLQVVDVPDPKPADDEYLIDIHACGANFFDLLQIRGKYQHQPPLPWIGGAEFSGIVINPPKTGSARFRSGDRVFGSTQGAFAQKVCVKPEFLHPIPEGWTFEQAAALYLTGPTSYAALVLRANIQPGEWALIHGAAGGVGLAAIQVAKARGAHVIATATSPRNISVCKSYGADHVLDYISAPQWETEAMKITGGHGVDVVFDPVGTISQSIKCAAWSARLVAIGFVGGQIESIKVNRILLRNISVVGLHWGPYAQRDPDAVPKVWAGLMEMIKEGKFRGTAFQPDGGMKRFVGLRDVGRGLKALEDKAAWGKVVIDLKAEDSGSKL
ncbi:MAG: hypothetical protein M1827_005218 [Pycnora praestabilis]|nr:MAG: hypothetical protein M1827_005218 [Pycnora praestabilis]